MTERDASSPSSSVATAKERPIAHVTLSTNLFCLTVDNLEADVGAFGTGHGILLLQKYGEGGFANV